MSDVCRFAPSTTGPAHPGTLLAALLAWLDARSRGARFVLRLENIDPSRSREAYQAAMVDDLHWFGLEWDEVQIQSELGPDHAAALDALERQGWLYPCNLSRSAIKKLGRRAPDGGFAYPNASRGRPMSSGGWRQCDDAVRLRLRDRVYSPVDEGGQRLVQNPAQQMGDPIVLRRDSSVAYNLAVVVDDAKLGVTRVIRGSDLATATATQLAIGERLGVSAPVYRHHLLLLEKQGRKLAKLHGAVGLPELRPHYRAPRLCGFLAWTAGLLGERTDATPEELLSAFSWSRVRTEDVLIRWDGEQLETVESGPSDRR